MNLPLVSVLVGLGSICSCAAASFDAAPFGSLLPEGNGVFWEDPREIHQVTVRFEGVAPPVSGLRLEYWGSRWPQQHLPKDRQPGGGDVGWMELGNWFNGGWRAADAEAKAEGSQVTFSFRPLNEKEHPGLKDYPVRFRYSLKIRVRGEGALPRIERIQAFTDSTYEQRTVRLAWERPPGQVRIEAFNGEVQGIEQASPLEHRLALKAVANTDPNTLDRTLVTVRNGQEVFTFGADNVAKEALFVPRFGVAVLPGEDGRDYAAVAARQREGHSATLYERVAQMPEQTWRSAWDNMPAKKSRICFPLGLDGGRQRFLLEADGAILFRANDHYLRDRPGKDTPRLGLEAAPVWLRFGALPQPVERHIEEESIPICCTTWEVEGLRISQTALVTELNGARADAATPPAERPGSVRRPVRPEQHFSRRPQRHLAAELQPRRGGKGLARRRPGPALAGRGAARAGHRRLPARRGRPNPQVELDAVPG